MAFEERTANRLEQEKAKVVDKQLEPGLNIVRWFCVLNALRVQLHVPVQAVLIHVVYFD